MRSSLKLSLVAGVLLMAAACNTVSGAGRDVSSAGDAVSNAADRNK